MEKVSVEALNSLEGDLKGKYYSLETMTPEENQQLIDDHFMFKNDDRLVRLSSAIKRIIHDKMFYWYHDDGSEFAIPLTVSHGTCKAFSKIK